MCATYKGTSQFIRPEQMNTSIFIELGNGDKFLVDMGEGSVANYVAQRFALSQINHIFITHLHVDHFDFLPIRASDQLVMKTVDTAEGHTGYTLNS